MLATAGGPMPARVPAIQYPAELIEFDKLLHGATWFGYAFVMLLGRRLEVFSCLSAPPGMTASGYFLGQAGISARARAIAGGSSGPVELSVNAQP
jgi:hypothetical protein